MKVFRTVVLSYRGVFACQVKGHSPCLLLTNNPCRRYLAVGAWHGQGAEASQIALLSNGRSASDCRPSLLAVVGTTSAACCSQQRRRTPQAEGRHGVILVGSERRSRAESQRCIWSQTPQKPHGRSLLFGAAVLSLMGCAYEKPPIPLPRMIPRADPRAADGGR